MGNVLALAQHHVVNSFLAPMFRDPTEAIPSQPMLQELIQQIPTLIAFIQSKPDLPESERSIYLGVIGNLEPVLQMAMLPCVDNRELRFLFFWPLHLRADFLGFLRRRHAGALAIVMYYATMLFASQSRYWFMEGWGEQLMRACYEELDQDWLPGVQWPASFVNHNPTWNLFSNLLHTQQGPSLPLERPSAGSSIYPQRKPAEVPIRQYAVSSPPSQETSTGAQMPPFSQHLATPGSRPGQGSGIARPGRQHISGEDTQ
jgi:hypothetical protein